MGVPREVLSLRISDFNEKVELKNKNLKMKNPVLCEHRHLFCSFYFTIVNSHCL